MTTNVKIKALKGRHKNGRLFMNPKKSFSIIPHPEILMPGRGVFRLTRETKLFYTPGAESVAAYFQTLLKNATHWSVPKQKMTAPNLPQNAIIFDLTSQNKALGDEGYRLDVDFASVRLCAFQPAGLFYGVQTLRQLLPPEFEFANSPPRKFWSIPAVQIEDRPRFGWRGLLLDCCRHFMTVEYVKRTIDWLAFYKLNRFHWHLTEDQGWRIEIKKYPRLTELAAWRTEPDGTRHGGFYTQEEIRDVVAYAAERFVTVIPEIEMPGHSLAALAAYPELSCTGGPFKVANQWSVFKDVYCAGKEETFRFLEDVLTEVLELFPSKYIHIGGDEVPKDRWKACSRCQARIRSEGLRDEDELQSYFIRRIEKWLNARGRQIIGWDEILQGGLAPGATVQSWRGVEGGIAAARAGHDVIMSPHTHVYFDHPAQFKGLARVYSFEPIPEELTSREARHVLGSESCMWTEYAPPDVVDTRIFPRLLAFAEAVWSRAPKSYPQFWDRTAEQYLRLRSGGVQIGSEGRPFRLKVRFSPDKRAFEVRLFPEEEGVELTYTLNGETPTVDSPRYQKPFWVTETGLLRVQAFWKNRPYGETVAQPLVLHKAVGLPVHFSVGAGESQENPSALLTDGLLGSTETNDGLWFRPEGGKFKAEIHFPEKIELRQIRVRFLQNTSRRAFLPVDVTFSVAESGRDFRLTQTIFHTISVLERGPLIHEFKAEFSGKKAEAIQIEARELGVCPPGHPGEGEAAWLLVDEIVVE